MRRCLFSLFFFFQAEDGIRDGRVTGVQTCALPIWSSLPSFVRRRRGSVMRIGAILRQWVDVLATLFLGWQERQRERRAVTLAFEGRHLVVRDIQTGQAIPAGAA